MVAKSAAIPRHSARDLGKTLRGLSVSESVADASTSVDLQGTGGPLLLAPHLPALLISFGSSTGLRVTA